jgi:hypothetical protein
MNPRPVTRAQDFRLWLEEDNAPPVYVYWTGWLVADAETDREARELAAAALFASGALPCVRRSGTGGSGSFVQPPAGPALIELSQRRLGDGLYEYRARKLPRRHRKAPTR